MKERERLSVSALLNNEDQNCEPEKVNNMKPFRKRIGCLQLNELQELFASGVRFPDKELRARLSERLKLTPRTIQVWFQNRRQNLKINAAQTDLQTVSILQSLRLAFK